MDQILFFTGTRLVGVSPADGKELWAFPWPTENRSNIATPICVGDYVFISTSYNKGCALIKVTADSAGVLSARKVYSSLRMRNHFQSCVFYKDHLYGFNEGFLACMEFRTGKAKWSQRGFGKGSILLADGHLVVLGEHGKLSIVRAIPHSFQEEASFHVTDEVCWTPPVICQGRLYIRTQQLIYCFDAKP